MGTKLWHILFTDEDRDPFAIRTFPVVVGRGDTCDVTLGEPTVSDRHVQINAAGKGITIHDLGSRNGTVVNGARVDSPVTLETTDRVELVVAGIPLALVYGAEGSVAREPRPAAVEPTVGWYYVTHGREYGPLTEAGILQARDRGLLIPTSLVWRADDPETRVPAAGVEGLFQQQGKVISGTRRHTEEGTATCPYCWHRFKPEEVLFVASHPDLVGDPVLGADAPQRFFPSRVTPDGVAMDAAGLPCHDIACPHCHSRIPRSLLDQPPLFVSIIGCPGSGKSFFLASQCWKLRTQREFPLEVTDADAEMNRWVNDYITTLFEQSDDAAYQTLFKTVERGEKTYTSVTLNGIQVWLARPCLFDLRPLEGAEADARLNRESRTLVFYDNAGEHFLPGTGADNEANPGTRHLAHAEGLIFLFDPIEEPRFRRRLAVADPQVKNLRVFPQQPLLIETRDRILKHMAQTKESRYGRPLIVAIAKADVLAGLQDIDGVRVLWDAALMDQSPLAWNDTLSAHALNLSLLAEVSFLTRELLDQYAPDIVRTAEAFADHVIYVPTSALGHSPTQRRNKDSDGSSFVVRPRDVRPKWVEVPILYLLARLGYIPVVSVVDTPPVAEGAKLQGRYIHLTVPGTSQRLRVPALYSGCALTCPYTGTRFRVPDVDTPVRF